MCEMFTKFLLLEAKVTIGDSSISCLKGKKWIKKTLVLLTIISVMITLSLPHLYIFAFR